MLFFLTNLAAAQTSETNTIDRAVTMGLVSALSHVSPRGNCANVYSDRVYYGRDNGPPPSFVL